VAHCAPSGTPQDCGALRPFRDPTFVHNVILYGIITDNEKPNFSNRTVQYSHFIYHKSHMDCPGMRRRPPWSDAATNHQNYGSVFVTSCCGRSVTRVMCVCVCVRACLRKGEGKVTRLLTALPVYPIRAFFTRMTISDLK